MNVYNNRSLNGLLNLNLDNLYINNELNTSALSYSEFYTLSGIITTTTIQNQLNTSNFSINNSKIDITLLQNLYNGLRYFLDEVNYLNIKTTGIEHTISSYITTINNKLNVNYIDTGYNDITREINAGSIIYGGSNYQNALNIYGKGPAVNQRQINLWDNVQIFGNLIVNGSTFLTSLSGTFITTVFGVSTVNTLTYGNQPTVTIDNTNPSNPKLAFGIPAGQPATNPNFSIGDVISSSSPYVTLGGNFPNQSLNFGLPNLNLSIGDVISSASSSNVSISGTFPNLLLNFQLQQGIQGSKGDKGDTGNQGGKGDKGDKGDTGDITVATTAAGAAAGSALGAAGSAFAAAGSAFTAGTAATNAATAAATCETLFQEIAPKVRNIETSTLNLNRTCIKGDLSFVDGPSLSSQIHLSNQPNETSYFFNNLQVNGKLYTNYVEVGSERPTTLWIGNDNNNKLNLQSKEEINIIGTSKVFINSKGEIVIESPTSITLRAPNIIIEGEVKNNIFSGLPSLSNYLSSLSNSVSTSNINGFLRQGFRNTFSL